jgi:hypothetical protein
MKPKGFNKKTEVFIMDFEIRTWNTDTAAEAINVLLPGRNIYLGDSILSGVQAVRIERGEISDSEPTQDHDGGRRDQISLHFEMGDHSTVTRFFEPINEACTVHLESRELMIISFIQLHNYVKRVTEELDERIKENQEFYSR